MVRVYEVMKKEGKKKVDGGKGRGWGVRKNEEEKGNGREDMDVTRKGTWGEGR